MLVVFGGLPGTGKTTIARQIAARHSATYLRIDEVEQAIRAQAWPMTSFDPQRSFLLLAALQIDADRRFKEFAIVPLTDR